MTRPRGFTLVELLITMFVFGVLGTALARLMISNSRFVSQQEAELEARQTARAAMNVMLPELRMVGDGGLRAAAPDSIKVRVPYAFGVLCHNEYAILAPADSAVFAGAVPGGIAYMTGGGYTFDSTITMAGTTTLTADCDSDSVRAVPGGQRITLTAPIGLSGSIFYLYQTVTYRFANSSAIPGRRGLWRQAQGAAAEELLSPFDTAARFVFLVGSRLTPQLAAPGLLSAVRGLELRLVGASVDAAQGEAQPTRFALHPRVRFGNMLAP